MVDDRKPVKVMILGEEYSLKGDASPEYVKELARYVDQKMKETSRQTKIPSLEKIAILVSLDLADELHKERRKVEHLLSRLREKHHELTEAIEQQLKTG